MSALESVIEQRNVIVDENAALLAGESTGDTVALIESNNAKLVEFDTRITTLEAAEKRVAELKESRALSNVPVFSGVKVDREELTYDRTLRNSWVRDMYLNATQGNLDARDRLQRHGKEVAIEEEKRKVAFAYDGEKRAISTTATAGGEFSPPLYLLDDFAEFARARRVAANLVTNMALPVGYSSIKIPAVTTGTKAAIQGGNNAAVTTRDIVTAMVTSNVETVAGYEDVSIQLIDQSPLGGGIDKLVFGDLMADYALAVNTAVIGNNDGTSNTLRGLIYHGQQNSMTTTWTETTPSSTNFLLAFNKALSLVVKSRYQASEGVILRPEQWYWLAAQVDSQGRPLVNISGSAYMPVAVNAAPGSDAGFMGTVSGVKVYVDATIPTTVNTNQAPIITGKFSDSYLFESGTKALVDPYVGSGTATVRFRLLGYVSFNNRFAKSVSSITGTGTVPVSGF
jgi:HK97 family phage major capsid protein